MALVPGTFVWTISAGCRSFAGPLEATGSSEISGAKETYCLVIFSGLCACTENGLCTLKKLDSLVDVLILITAATVLPVIMPSNAIDSTQGYAYSSSAG